MATDLDAYGLNDVVGVDGDLSEERHQAGHFHDLQHHHFRAYVEMYTEITIFVYMDQA